MSATQEVKVDCVEEKAALPPQTAFHDHLLPPENLSGCQVQMCRLSAAALIARWDKRGPVEAKVSEARLEKEVDFLEARLNLFMRDKSPALAQRPAQNPNEEPSQGQPRGATGHSCDRYVWVYPVVGARDKELIDRCVERINQRNQLKEEESRWAAHNSSNKLQKSITVALTITTIPKSS